MAVVTVFALPAAPSRLHGNAWTVASAVFVGAAATVSAISVGSGHRAAVVLPVAIALGVLLAALALTRFGAYVMLMLVLRSSLDAAKLSHTGAYTGPAALNPNVAPTTVAPTSGALNPASMFEVLFLIAGTLWLIAQHHRYGRVPGSRLRRTLMLFAVTGVISITGSVKPLASVTGSIKLLTVVLIFTVLERMMTDRAVVKRFLIAAYVSVLFPILYTIFGYLTGHPPTEDKGSVLRLTGTFVQSNPFGRYLMLLIIFGVALLPYLSRRKRLALGSLLAVCAAFLVLTFTLTALLGAVIGLFVVGWQQNRKLALAVLVVAVFAALLVPELSARIGSVTSANGYSGSSANGNSLAWRLGYWTQILPLANHNPVTGIGLGATQYLTVAAKPPHSDFVRAYVETGLLGLATYLAFLAALVSTGRKAVRSSVPGTLDRGIAVGFLGCAVAYVAASAAANVVSDVVNLWYLATFAAAASAVVRLSRPPGTPVLESASVAPAPRSSAAPPAVPVTTPV